MRFFAKSYGFQIISSILLCFTLSFIVSDKICEPSNWTISKQNKDVAIRIENDSVMSISLLSAYPTCYIAYNIVPTLQKQKIYKLSFDYLITNNSTAVIDKLGVDFFDSLQIQNPDFSNYATPQLWLFEANSVSGKWYHREQQVYTEKNLDAIGIKTFWSDHQNAGVKRLRSGTLQCHIEIKNFQIQEINMKSNELVENGSFEIQTQNQTNSHNSNMEECYAWNNIPLQTDSNVILVLMSTDTDAIINQCQLLGTPDYYHENKKFLKSIEGSMLPKAKEGKSYVGINLYSSTNESSLKRGREYIYAKLQTDLVIGQKYSVQYSILKDGNSGIASNALGLKFFNELPTYSPKSAFYNLISDIGMGDSLITAKDWVTIKKVFVADSSYKYLMLGDFDQEVTPTRFERVGSGFFSYYFIDDVKVIHLE